MSDSDNSDPILPIPPAHPGAREGLGEEGREKTVASDDSDTSPVPKPKKKRKRKELTEEQKERRLASLAKAREARKKKKRVQQDALLEIRAQVAGLQNNMEHIRQLVSSSKAVAEQARIEQQTVAQAVAKLHKPEVTSYAAKAPARRYQNEPVAYRPPDVYDGYSVVDF